MGSYSVHIVILNWNGLEDTLECLRSVSALTYPDIRVQLVDNASSNNEAKKIASEFPNINVIANVENLGFCGGCNMGMRQALIEGADFVMLLNNDTIVPPDLVDVLVEEYVNLDHPGAVSPVILKYPETDKVWFSIAQWETDWRRGEAQFRLTLEDTYEVLRLRSPYKSEFACGCCLFVSSDVIKKTGFFDERYFAFFDEAEWCARMSQEGYESYVVPAAHMYHKVGGSVPSLVMTYLLSRNRLLWISDNLGFSQKLKAYPILGKDLVWHLLNLAGVIRKKKQHTSRKYSRAVVWGTKDYLFRRFGKWHPKAEKTIFDPK